MWKCSCQSEHESVNNFVLKHKESVDATLSLLRCNRVSEFVLTLKKGKLNASCFAYQI